MRTRHEHYTAEDDFYDFKNRTHKFQNQIKQLKEWNPKLRKRQKLRWICFIRTFAGKYYVAIQALLENFVVK